MSATAAMIWNGFREARRNRVTIVVGVFAALVLFATPLVSEVTVNTFYRVLTDFGLGMMSLILVFLAVFLSSGLLSREIERRTIFMIVSKPVSRTRFLLARLAGNMLTLTVLTTAMTAIFFLQLLVLRVDITSMQLVAIVGLLFELLVLTSAGFLFSSFSSQMVSAVCVTGLYFVGHLAPDIHSLAQLSKSGLVKAVGTFAYYLVPNLERLNFRPEASYRLAVEGGTLVSSMAYAVGWSALFCIAAAFIFERRDFR